MTKLKLGSLFSGSGGFELGAVINGITPVWSSEIEPFPIRVTTKRFPYIKHYGDICKMNGAEIEAVDIITFGSPCTDLSIAGKRAGLEGKQSSLFHEAIRVIKEMRCKTNGKYPRFIVWENVLGAFSSTKGEDFRGILTEIAKIKDETIDVPMPEKYKWLCAGEIVADGFSIAWRVLDSQYWGVPQRRRRIYLVADFASECARKILFESEGLSGYSQESIKLWQRVTKDAKDSIGETISFELGAASRIGGHCWDDSTCNLRANMGDNQLAVAVENHPADCRIKIDDMGMVQTLTGRMGTGGGNIPMVMNKEACNFEIDLKPETLKIRSGREGGGKGAIIQKDKSATLSCNNEQAVFIPKVYGICSDKSKFMECKQDTTLAYSIDRAAYNQGKNAKFDISIKEEQAQTLTEKGSNAVAWNGDDVCSTLTVNNAAGNQRMPDKGNFNSIVEPNYNVRRLTPTECALLQGFPANWCSSLETENPSEEEVALWSEFFETHRKISGKSTRPKTKNQIIKWLKKPYSDSAEYKMWGNGVALPCVCFVLAGIVWIDIPKGNF
jgi:DNA (cytosine-5)-methyltransferase 1